MFLAAALETSINKNIVLNPIGRTETDTTCKSLFAHSSMVSIPHLTVVRKISEKHNRLGLG